MLYFKAVFYYFETYGFKWLKWCVTIYKWKSWSKVAKVKSEQG